MKFFAFAASHRPESFNRKLVAHAAGYVREQSHTVDFAEYGELDMPLYNDTKPIEGINNPFAQRLAAADALLLSCPEYNWSFPGSLKNIIDWTSRLKPNPIKGRPVLLMCATPGMRGGILGLSHVKSPFDALQTFVFNRVYPLGNCAGAFDENGKLLAGHHESFKPILDDFVTFAGHLAKK
jgi:chromate reductase